MSLTLIQEPEYFSFSGNPILVEVDNAMGHIVGSDPILNYKIGVRILVHNGSDFVEIKELLHNVSAEGRAIFNLAPYLKNESSSLPTIGNTNIFRTVSPGLVYYKFEYFSQGGANQAGIEQETSTDKYALNGGTSIESYSESTLTDHIQARKYLTHAPNRYLKKGEDEYLSFCLPEGDALVVTVSGKLANGDDFSLDWPSTAFAVRKIYELNVAKMIEIVTQGNDFEYVDISLKDSYNDEKLEPKRYYGDPRSFNHKAVLLYLNSFGVWESVSLYGKIENSVATVSDSAIFGNRVETWNREMFEKYTCTVDYKTPGELNHLKDLIRSKKVYLKGASEWIPVRFPDSNIKLFSTADYTLPIKLKFETIYQNEYISN